MTPHFRDYGFNFYNAYYSKRRDQTQKDKFQHMYSYLKLEKGMKLIEIGCGCGDCMYYLKERGWKLQ